MARPAGSDRRYVRQITRQCNGPSRRVSFSCFERRAVPARPLIGPTLYGRGHHRMKRLLPIFVVAGLGVFWFMKGGSMSSSDSVEYQGKSVKLSKPYSDYDDYKNDPNNLGAGEAPKVQQLVKSAPIAKHFADRKALVAAVFELKFPGYGVGSYAATPQPDGSLLELWGVEIPQASSTRFLLFRGRNGTYDLVDDFVQPDGPMIGSVTMTGEEFVYVTQQGAKVVERAPSIK
jgi:hypothetical protein